MSNLLTEFADKNPSMDELATRAEELGLKPADSGDLLQIVEKVVQDRIDFVKERGMGAMGPLMGLVMKECGGAADGKQIRLIVERSHNEACLMKRIFVALCLLSCLFFPYASAVDGQDPFLGSKTWITDTFLLNQ